MRTCFAITADGEGRPAAFFEELEDAMEWALDRFGSDAFSIRRIDVVEVQREERLRLVG